LVERAGAVSVCTLGDDNEPSSLAATIKSVDLENSTEQIKAPHEAGLQAFKLGEADIEQRGGDGSIWQKLTTPWRQITRQSLTFLPNLNLWIGRGSKPVSCSTLRGEDSETLYRRCSRDTCPFWLRGSNDLDQTRLNAR
jgi:hypothetical protein